MEQLFHSRAAAGVLGVLLLGKRLHLREIARRAGVSPSEAKRELDLLERLGIAVSEREGRQKFFSKNPQSPILPELDSLFRKTDMVIAGLGEALQKLAGIKYALVFGSQAKGGLRRSSDIDVLVIGGVVYGELDSAVYSMQEKSGREINYILWKEEELLEKAKKGSGLVGSIAKGGWLWLAGDEDGFVRAVKAGAHKKIKA